MQILENTSLKAYNTFGIEAYARYFATYETETELIEFLKSGFLWDKNHISIGGGSNLLFTQDFEGVVLHSQIKTMEQSSEDDDSIFVRVGAGVVWDDFVAHCVQNGWGGVENLSLIPGEVGASPVQNIGAYGVEAKDVIVQVEGVFIDSAEKKILTYADCRFGYRDSVFKHELAGRFIVTHVLFRLDKKPVFKLEYGTVKEELEKLGEITLESIRNVIIQIRESKLPDYKLQGNAGSFFKNPVVSRALFEALLHTYPAMPHYTVSADEVKIPAAWLIEQAGWKGKAHGNAAVHDKQPLVLVNRGHASGAEIVELSNLIRASVTGMFGIDISPEVIFL